MLLDLLNHENSLFMSEGDGGGAGNPTEADKDKDKDKGNEGKGNEETITLTKAEYEAKLNQKFAEGARKAQEGKLNANSANSNPNPVNPQEQSNSNLAQNPNEDIAKLKDELSTFKALTYATDNGIKPEYKEDLVAIVKGKGLEPTPENIKKEADKHPEWKYSSDGSNGGGAVKPLGSSSGSNTPPALSEKEQAAKLFGL